MRSRYHSLWRPFDIVGFPVLEVIIITIMFSCSSSGSSSSSSSTSKYYYYYYYYCYYYCYHKDYHNCRTSASSVPSVGSCGPGSTSSSWS